MKTLICALLFFTGASLAADDLTGKWTGSFTRISPSGEERVATALLHLKQNGKEITGSGGANQEQQTPISNGKVDDDVITFDLASHNPPLKFVCRLKDGRIQGEVTAEGRSDLKARLDVKKSTE